MSKKVIFITLVALLVPFSVLAATYVYDYEILPENWEVGLEMINLLIAVIAAAFAIKLAALSQGGDLEKSWNWLAIAASVFAVLEIFEGLKGLKLVHLGGFGDILELIMVIILFKVFYQTRKILLKRAMGK